MDSSDEIDLDALIEFPVDVPRTIFGESATAFCDGAVWALIKQAQEKSVGRQVCISVGQIASAFYSPMVSKSIKRLERAGLLVIDKVGSGIDSYKAVEL